jgi:pyridoxine 5-phosphate synthase
MTKLSVNVNKVALLRNTRDIGIPSVMKAVEAAVRVGVHGITVHPRPDQRHIRPNDVFDIAEYLKHFPLMEFNIEGNPFPDFMKIVRHVKPQQVTLVPDTPGQSTSDHGWNVIRDCNHLKPIIDELHELGCRVSLFLDPDMDQLGPVPHSGADRIELYTQPYAAAFAAGRDVEKVWKQYHDVARLAMDMGLSVNAGHDLNLVNLPKFLEIPGIAEVSIGHALIADALDMGLESAIRAYLQICLNSA